MVNILKEINEGGRFEGNIATDIRQEGRKPVFKLESSKPCG